MEYLPPSQNGSIIMTTRDKGVALKMAEEDDIITVEPMNKLQALALFKKKLDIEGDDECVSRLAAALGFMPLAIAQAASYINRRLPRCSVLQYFEEFQKNDRKKVRLLSYEGGHIRRDHEAKNAIFVTWQVSFDHIQKSRPSAADLLSLMSFCDRQGIPDFMLRQQPGTEGSDKAAENYATKEGTRDHEDDKSDLSTENMFEDDIVVLRDYSFVSVGWDEASFEIHSFIQLAMQQWLKANGQLERWKREYIRQLRAEFPTGSHRNWDRCQLLFPHIKSAFTQRPDASDSE